ncbi:MAG: asparaginase [Lachnospiraceae bacterium]|nr:asparaginase [Lachnospiraceae bacterium]
MTRILIIGTGGTIAGISNNSKGTDYVSGARNVEELCEGLKGASYKAGEEKERNTNIVDSFGLVNITTENMFNKNSDDITITDLVRLKDLIDDHSKKDIYDGFVITHGTDTMEETAFFLSLCLKTDKPVILTGSMIPSDIPGSDGPENLTGSIKAVCDLVNEGKNGRKVHVYFHGKLMDGKNIIKTHTESTDCFREDEKTGFSLHNLFNSICDYIGLHNVVSVEDIPDKINGLTAFPTIPVIPFHMDADPGVIDYYVNQSAKGMVIAGAGAGEFSLEYVERIKNSLNGSKIPVIRTSKIKNGPVNDNGTFDQITINGGSMTPEKAAVLLRILLAIKG